MTLHDTTIEPTTRGGSGARSARQHELVRVFGILTGAVLALVALEAALFALGWAQQLAARLAGVNWLWMLGAFLVAGWLARGLAHRVAHPLAQWSGLALYVVAQALILAPMLVWSERAVPGVTQDAARLTLVASVALFGVAWISRKDFSFLRPFLIWGGLLALGAIVLSALTDWRLGLWFSVAMILLAGGGILYDASKLRRGGTRGREVAVALELFASMAMMFWYVLRLSRQIQR